MAEATRTLSLEDDNTHDSGDQLWMGHSVIPRDVACCETTVNLPSFSATAAATGDSRESVFVVDDLTKHPDLCERPYVTSYPNGRYYAGVPITTPLGVNIGAYCILDDKPRQGISQRDLIFMRDMSQTVMTHLETIRALSDRRQNSQMVAGLGQFIRGPSALKREVPSVTNMPLDDSIVKTTEPFDILPIVPDALIDIVASPVVGSSHSARKEYFDNKTVKEQQNVASDSSDIGSHVPQHGYILRSVFTPKTDLNTTRNRVELGQQGQVNSLDTSMAAEASTLEETIRPPLANRFSTHNRRGAFQRAAEILCRSLRIDGAAFLDTSVRSFGGLAETTETSTGGSDDSAPENIESATEELNVEDTKACKVLGCAQIVRRGGAEREFCQQPRKLTESFIRHLMRRNPEGKVWTFDEDLNAPSEDDISTEDESADCDLLPGQASTASSSKKSARKKRHSDGENLQLAFPGARCIALHGIWDSIRRRWSVAGLFWTYDPLRVLSESTEMQFVAAFCEVVTAETKRLEAVGSDKAKSDFISSVSHELRSPLHGILGSVEVLAEQELDSTASTLVEQITSCGRTLLEIIDHLLDFANLKQQRLKKGMVKSSRIGRKVPASVLGVPDNDLTALNMNVSLDEVTEDVVVSSVYSFYYNHDSTDETQTSVILDIDRSEGTTWSCQLATGGWKRVCMNLVINALKYTPVGFVRVSLKQKSRPGLRRRFDAVLTVTDCGIGMSKEFQKNHLFRDFSQEDTQSSGLGIGMHMVARMVSAMGGEIEVTSDQRGVGTRVTVTVPLEDHRDRSHSGREGSTYMSKEFEGLHVGIITDVHSLPDTRDGRLMDAARRMSIASIRKNLEYVGMSPKNCISSTVDSDDLKVVTETNLTTYLQSVQRVKSSNGRTNFTPVLVICNNAPSAHISRELWSKNPLGAELAVEYIALPCGVKQIVRAIASALKLDKELLRRLVARPQSFYEQKATEISSRYKSSEHTGSSDKISVQASTIPSPDFNGPRTASATMETEVSQRQELQTRSIPISLPRSRASTLHAAVTQQPDSLPITNPLVPAQTPMADSPILLLVDDNCINLQLLTMFAKKRGYPYTTAVDGKLAVETFVKAHKESLCGSETDVSAATDGVSSFGLPNVILMDINMPVMDGYEAVQRIRTYEAKHHLRPAKIIAVTALQSEAAHVEAFGSGFNMFLTKPLKLKSLTKIIEVD
ncbi:hypothetical protein MBLNU13_g09831t2 [Cladosporium sp. NU13]